MHRGTRIPAIALTIAIPCDAQPTVAAPSGMGRRAVPAHVARNLEHQKRVGRGSHGKVRVICPA